MSQSLFCYHCRAYHPLEAMTRYPTKKGLRWRCINSLRAANQDLPSRDAFGRAQTAANQEMARRHAQQAHLIRISQVREW